MELLEGVGRWFFMIFAVLVLIAGFVSFIAGVGAASRLEKHEHNAVRLGCGEYDGDGRFKWVEK